MEKDKKVYCLLTDILFQAQRHRHNNDGRASLMADLGIIVRKASQIKKILFKEPRPKAGHFEQIPGGWRVQHATCAIEHKEKGPDENKG